MRPAPGRRGHLLQDRHPFPLSLQIHAGRWGAYRLPNIDDARSLYELLDDELVILVVRVAHRRESYRRR